MIFAVSPDTPTTLAGWVIWCSVFLAAISTIWRIAVRPGFRIAKTVDRIMDEFRENGGNSTKDQLNRLEVAVAANAVLGETAKAIAEAAKETAEVGKRLIDEEQVRFGAFEQYVHSRFHDVVNALAAIKTMQEAYPPSQTSRLSDSSKKGDEE